MKIFVDTDVLLDVALNRKAFVAESAEVLRWASRTGKGAIAWHSLSNCAYLLKGDGRDFLVNLLGIVQVVTCGQPEALRALRLPMNDLEDALQATAALAFGADWIVTRNGPDFRNSPVPALSPADFLKIAR
ncbi:MAG: PIN domain-containing protein [Kiritimatiellae bacterium]|nr:PIN domain-containing protein [Kiritimatiellia bacterium]